MPAQIIPKTYTREFPLIFCQLWAKAYNNFLDVIPKINPRYIYFFHQGLAVTYRNPVQERELNQIFLDRLKVNQGYLKEFCTEYLNEFRELEKIWHQDFLDHSTLDAFIDRLIAFWPAEYASLYIAKDDRFAAGDRDLALALRKTIDVMADKATDIIVRSLKKLYPYLGEMVYAVSLEDFRGRRVNKKDITETYSHRLILAEDTLVSEGELAALKKKYDFDFAPDEKIASGVREISGQIACPGKARGMVKLVFRRQEINKVKEGEILVAAMTVPDFLPAMKKAAAFITDEGGITCHAAIVAREMKKPCIIGTKIATQVLKDGDEVEVDADKGIIKILNI